MLGLDLLFSINVRDYYEARCNLSLYVITIALSYIMVILSNWHACFNSIPYQRENNAALPIRIVACSFPLFPTYPQLVLLLFLSV